MAPASLLLLALLGAAPDSDLDPSGLEAKPRGEPAAHSEPYIPQPGDIIVFRSRSLYIRIAYCLSTAGGATHCGLVVKRPNGSLGLLEAPGPRFPVMSSDLPSRFSYYDGKIWVRHRRASLTEQESAALTAFACGQIGKHFNMRVVAAPVFGKPVRSPQDRCTCPKELNQERWFCSELLAAALVNAGQLDPFVARPRFTDPEDIASDRWLDLSGCWEKMVPLPRCGPRSKG